MKKELRKLPIASEVKRAKMQIELATNIYFLGNQTLVKLEAALNIKQNPSEHMNVPTKKNE